MDHDDQFWRGKRVMLTGHTGFKGSWLHLWLRTLGATVTGYALAPPTEPSLWSIVGAGARSVIADIRDEARVRTEFAAADPQIVIHMAAQALVRESYRDPIGTYATNVMGTANVLQACRDLGGLECVLVVTSDKVYQNEGAGQPRMGQPGMGQPGMGQPRIGQPRIGQPGMGQPFDESDRLGGHDPYSNSKACAELVTASFRDSFYSSGAPLASARAGNVIGGGDWSVDRLIPDCVRALEAGVPVTLRYPGAVRPWQHVLEPLCGYLALARALVESPASAPRAVNFGPAPRDFCAVSDVVDAFSTRFDGRPGWRRDDSPQPAEAAALTLSSTLAERTLHWRPRLGLQESLSWTADWYKARARGEDMVALTERQLAQYRERLT